jgi:hypothetical protein
MAFVNIENLRNQFQVGRRAGRQPYSGNILKGVGQPERLLIRKGINAVIQYDN